jgi:methylglutamate dehydrogenase subunit D
MVDRVLVPRSAFASVTTTVGAGRGVVAMDCDGLGLAIVLVRRGQLPILMRQVRECFDIELPCGPRRAAAGDLAFAGIAPDGWLVTRQQHAATLASDLKEALGACASVSDQSDGYAVLRVTGPSVRESLAKILAIDLHPRVFRHGDVAITAAAHIGVTVSRLNDGAEGWPLFEIAVFRSLARSFWHALGESAAQSGLVLASECSRANEAVPNFRLTERQSLK